MATNVGHQTIIHSLCPGDLAFGPGSDCRSLDFSITFQQSILLLLPSACFVLIAAYTLATSLFTKRGTAGFSTTAPRSSPGSLSNSDNLVVGKDARTAVWQRYSNTEIKRDWLLVAKLLLGSLTGVTSILSLFSWSKAESALRLEGAQWPFTLTWAARATTMVACALALLPTSLECHRQLRGPSTRLTVFFLVKLLFLAVYLRTTFDVGLDTLAPFDTAIQVILTTLTALNLLVENIQRLDDGIRLPDTNASEPPNPEEGRGVLSRASMLWHFPLLLHGLNNRIVYSKLYGVPERTRARTAGQTLQDAFEKTKPGKHRFLLATVKAFLPFWLGPVLPRLVQIAAQMTQQLAFADMIRFVSSYAHDGDHTPEPVSRGFAIAGGILVLQVITVISNSVYWEHVYKASLNVRAAVVAVIYRKTLKLNVHLPSQSASPSISDDNDKQSRSSSAEPAQALAQSSSDSPQKSLKTHDPSTLMSVDVEKITIATDLVHELWASLVIIVLALGLLYTRLGVAFVSCIAFIFVFLAATVLVSRLSQTRQKHWLGTTQDRGLFTASLVKQLTPIKLSEFIDYFRRTAASLRRDEADAASTFYRWLSVMVASSVAAPNMLAIIGFLTTWAIKGSAISNLDTATVFSALSIMQLLDGPLNAIANVATLVTTTGISFERIQEFLLSEEWTRESSSGTDTEKLPIDDGEAGIAFELLSRAGFSSRTICGQDNPGQLAPLIAVIGQSGSGKTIMLRTIIDNAQGRIKIAYCPQDPWIENDTIRNNITFGAIYDANRFDQVVRISGLKEDLASLPLGQDTLLGSKGITLSGGQRHRVALARAFYSDARLILLDDSLSAVDARTFDHISRSAIDPRQRDQLLKGRTIVWTTHSFHSLEESDPVVLIKQYEVNDQGTLADVLQRNTQLHPSSSSSSSSVNSDSKQDSGEIDIVQDQLHRTRQEIQAVNDETITPLQPEATQPAPDASPSNDDEEDESEDSKLSGALYRFYFGPGKVWQLVLCLVTAIVGVALVFTGQVVVEQWTHGPGGRVRDTSVYLGTFLAVSVASMLALVLFVYVYLCALVPSLSQKIHAFALDGVFRSSVALTSAMGFGRIKNRFTQDMIVCDTEFPIACINVLMNGTSGLGGLIFVFVAAPYAAATVPVLGVVYYMLQKLYLRNSRQIRRMDLEAKSILFNSFEWTKSGIETIRAFRNEAMYIEQNLWQVDRSQKPFYARSASIRFLRTGLYTIAAVVISVLSFAVVGLRKSTSPGLLGLALTNVTTLAMTLNAFLQSWVMLETAAVAVDRLRELSLLEDQDSEEIRAKAKAHETGASIIEASTASVEWSAFKLKYKSDGPQILKGVSLTVPAGTKLGLCGRTGSGKSTLLTGLLRGVQPDLTQGSIMIGGMGTSDWPARKLRSYFNLVSQDALVWNRSVRELLYPSDEDAGAIPDNDLWAALQAVSLGDLVSNCAHKLDAKLVEEGEESEGLQLSRGQKQLLCMARAILLAKQRPILLLDEATSSLDIESEKVIKRVIRTHFAHHTVIAVAHRITTLLESDDVAVLQAGQVIEQGPPQQLLLRPDSEFRKLAASQGLEDALTP